jgi:hypothetical protein
MTEPVERGVFQALYADFAMPLTPIDCGGRCGPHNDYGVPFCCDIEQVIPSAFELEWSYLRENSDLWVPWSSCGNHAQEVEGELQDGQVLLQCKGYRECQREFRTLTCRAFPFFPYLDEQGKFTGMAYYHDFRQECWIISNLDRVSQTYKEAFQSTFQRVFDPYPDFKGNFRGYCDYVRAQAADKNEEIILLGFSGEVNSIDPGTQQLYQVEYKELAAFGPYEITRELQFPDEREPLEDTD